VLAPGARLSPGAGMATMTPLPYSRQARLRSRAFVATVALLMTGLLAACTGGTGKATPTPGAGAVPTAAPYASVPEPTIVTRLATPSPTPTGSATPTSGTGAAAPEQTYTVVAGDVLGSIADKFDVPSAAIRALNNLTGDSIQIGQKLRIPAKTPGTTSPGATGVTTYTVKAGDTAFGIALQFDTTTEALERANGVQKGGLDNLQLGQVVKLPPPGQR
jgi:LysM repeat protein